MTRDWESAFSFWARPPSKTEEQRSENAIRAIRKAVQGSSKLNQRSIKVFTQGSYRNRVNVRQDSDLDVGVMLYDFFIDEYPAGRTRADFGFSAAGYSFSQFKNELEAALVDHFGRAAVKRGNKAFNIRENTYHVEADVVPIFEFRRYWESRDYRAGVALMTDQGRRIENYPERLAEHWPSTPLHYENGNSKNTDTSRRYRGLVRILKNIRNEMEDTGSPSAKSIPGYLLECLCWNVPNAAFTGSTWDARVQAVLLHLWSNTKDDATCKSWCEVDAIKWVYPGFPMPFWGLSGFFVGELTGKALWKLVENAQRFPRRGGRVLRPRRRQLPQGPSVCDKMAPREGATRDIELDRRAGG